MELLFIGVMIEILRDVYRCRGKGVLNASLACQYE